MTNQDYDVVAIGAGPCGLAFGIAMEELAPDHLVRRTVLLEQHPDIQWQRGLLLPWAVSQVSCLKDLVMLRNPTSRFTFLNFLHENGRLDDFINLGTFTPYRSEISDYLQWVADTLRRVRIQYNRRCRSIEPIRDADGVISWWLIRLEDGSTITTRDLVYSAGRNPYVPEPFINLPADRIVHSTEYMEKISQIPKDAPYRVLVVGGAQSAAEMFRAVHDDLPNCRPTIVMRSVGFGNYQTSKFMNELFYPSFTDTFFNADEENRRQILHEMHQTNYAGLAPNLLDELYRMLYLQRLGGKKRSRVITLADVTGTCLDGDEIVVELHHRIGARHTEELQCDIVLLGTGFDRRQPQLLRDLSASLGRDSLTVNRSYRIDPADACDAGLYLQGINEDTHGIADSLLSVLAHRTKEVVDDIVRRRENRFLSTPPELDSADPAKAPNK